jgi:hypothetical protein
MLDFLAVFFYACRIFHKEKLQLDRKAQKLETEKPIETRDSYDLEMLYNDNHRYVAVPFP